MFVCDCDQIQYRLGYKCQFFHIIVIHYTGITQRPHDHLFQKSGHLGATWVHKLLSKNIDKFELFVHDCNQILYRLGYMG